MIVAGVQHQMESFPEDRALDLDRVESLLLKSKKRFTNIVIKIQPVAFKFCLTNSFLNKFRRRSTVKQHLAC